MGEPQRPAGGPRIAVWAPAAERVEVEWALVPGSTDRSPGRAWLDLDPMTADGNGWWRWEPTADEREGDATASGRSTALDYAFVLDGAHPALPDPRSAWQPHGVHGPSRTFDASLFAWTDHGWRGPRSGAGVLGSVVYELHVGTFTPEGTLDAAVARLDHLVGLGVDVVELMPVASFPGRWGWGYDGVGLYAVHDGYGGPAALQRFVDACHARGLGVALDVVHNHLGASGNYLERFGPYFTEAHHTPGGRRSTSTTWGRARCDGSSSTAP